MVSLDAGAERRRDRSQDGPARDALDPQALGRGQQRTVTAERRCAGWLCQPAIALKQGAGRLIRTETDRGVLMICDPRLTDKPYGRRIWKSLPPMRRTRELADVVAFLADGGEIGSETN